MHLFSDQLESIRPVKEGFKGHISDNWLQGRTVFGGLSAAMAAHAAKKTLPLEHQLNRPLKSILVTFAGPIGSGDLRFATNLIRSGGKVSIVHVTAFTPDGQPALLLQASFGASRDTKAVPAPQNINLQNKDSVADSTFTEESMPDYLKSFHIRWTGGGIPASLECGRKISFWAKHKSDNETYQIEHIIALADIPPPVMLSHYDKLIPSSSLTWCCDFIQSPDQISGEWFYLDYRLIAAHAGYSQQSGRVYDETGNLVAISSQCMTYFE